MKFRKKPVVIEALQLTRDKAQAAFVRTWCGGEACFEGLTIRTLEGVMVAQFGDWVIRGVKGEFYPCKHGIFIETYEPEPQGVRNVITTEQWNDACAGLGSKIK